ncbi:succinyldiaminopimelate transaminase [Methylotuvimicrobium buryatense]|uniref:Succinyldiaminopimelate transaminase n=1 Tax=Methylotuvimicrobium buryatense TaxID=95641 RepID=A0A4P9UM90_METBY|nr:succinyldiaminopimelate transaminase [Methylotuvimicrobium buryatense]QCW82348.1 succinyldiaminopimelate transaminase [Methylotuvimicrobium buryatense]
MNPNLNHLQPYPFEKLARLKQGIVPPTDKAHIALSIGEPKHITPHIIQEALITHMHGLSAYPSTRGLPELRQSMSEWIARRFQIPADLLDPETQILPVNGTREALFSFAQCLVEPSEKPLVLMPNPFYQIYEGAALLAGAQPYFLNTTEENAYLPDFDTVPESVWRRCQLLYICSPGNPTGAVIPQTQLEYLIELAERYDFVIASDECYSEIYADENNPPTGLLEAAVAIGNTEFKRCVIFHSLSKRSNAPGLRSGFVAGDAEILQRYFQYRTYHGCAMPVPTQHASIAAWRDEAHVVDNRQLYREKFSAFKDILSEATAVTIPPASFYIWLKTPVSEIQFAQQLFASENVTVLPGSYLSRPFNESDPGRNHVRIALVAPIYECIDAARRIKNFIHTL